MHCYLLRVVPEAVDTAALAPRLHRELVAQPAALSGATSVPLASANSAASGKVVDQTVSAPKGPLRGVRVQATAAANEVSAAAADHVRIESFPWSSLEPCRLDDFVFLSVFKWEKRKGWDVLLRAYFNTFAVPAQPVGNSTRHGNDINAAEFDTNEQPAADDSTRPDHVTLTFTASASNGANVCLVIKSYLFGDADPHNARRIRELIVRFAEDELQLDASRLPRFAVISEVCCNIWR